MLMMMMTISLPCIHAGSMTNWLAGCISNAERDGNVSRMSVGGWMVLCFMKRIFVTKGYTFHSYTIINSEHKFPIAILIISTNDYD